MNLVNINKPLLSFQSAEPLINLCSINIWPALWSERLGIEPRQL